MVFMKTTIKSLLILGLLSNFNNVFSMNSALLSKNINDKSIQSFHQLRASEQTKRRLRYCAGGIGLLGIGGLIYYSVRSNEGQQVSSVNVVDFKALQTTVNGLAAAAANGPLPLAPVVPWSTAARSYAFGAIKNSSFCLSTIGTAIFLAGVQGIGASIFTKSVLNPLAEKLIGIYSMNRFIASTTKINQNIKDLIRTLVAINKENAEDVAIQKEFFDITFGLLERDMVNILGFMMYIGTLLSKDEPLVFAKAKVILQQAKKNVVDLHRLKEAHFEIEEYKDLLSEFVDKCESFSDMCAYADTDLMEDLYASTFEQLKKSINRDIPVQLPAVPDLDTFQQLLESMAGRMNEDEQI